MKKSMALVMSAALATSACQMELTGGEVADVASTSVALSVGMVEANPIWSWCGVAAPLCVALGKAAIKRVAEDAGADPQEVAKAFHTTGVGAACANGMGIALHVTGAASGGTAVAYQAIAGFVCYYIAVHEWEQRQKRQQEHYALIIGRRENE